MIDASVIDDRASGDLTAPFGRQWRLLTDSVMGGVSEGRLLPDEYLGKSCLRLRGQVSTRNNGGFIQMTIDLGGRGPFDASDWHGLVIEVAGNGESYNLHLRTAGLMFPWQSYRAGFDTSEEWQRIHIPFASLSSYRTTRAFRPDRIQRIGLVAIGHEFEADLRLADIRLYRD